MFPVHDDPEIMQQPLEEMILRLLIVSSHSFDYDGVLSILNDLLEIPNVKNVESSFQVLFDGGMINEPYDSCYLTIG